MGTHGELPGCFVRQGARLTGRGWPVGLNYDYDSSVAMSVLMASSLLFWFMFCGERSTRFSLQSWYRSDSVDLGTVMSVSGIFTFREIETYQDSLGTDSDVSAWFNLGALSRTGLGIQLS